MAETPKLSVGQALDKMRGTEPPSSKVTQLDSKIGALDEEMRRMKAASRRIERDQRAASTVPPPPQREVAGRAAKFGVLGIMVALAVVILILTWKWLS
jgi:hypothetical protein